MQKARHPSYPIKSNLTITSLIYTLGFKASSIDQKQSLRAPQVQYKRPQSDSKSTNHVLPIYLKLQSKTHSTSQQSHNSEGWGWKYGYKGTFPLFLTTSLNFLFSLIVGQSFRPVELHISYRAETWEQKPTEPGNILTILNLRGGNMGTGEPSFSSSRPPSISFSWWLWVEVSNLLCFYAFFALLLLAFWFSFVKAPLAFCSLYIWNFRLDSPQKTLLKSP